MMAFREAHLVEDYIVQRLQEKGWRFLSRMILRGIAMKSFY